MTGKVRQSKKMVNIHKSRKCYKVLLICLIAAVITGVLNFLLTAVGMSRATMDILDGLSALIIFFCGLLYLVVIAALAAENHKNPVLWLFLAMIFAPLGTIISFFMMRSLGKKNGWI